MTFRFGDVWRLVFSWLSSAIALSIAGAALSGLSADSWWSYLIAAAITAVVGFFLRPIIVIVASRLGWLAIMVATLVGQAAILTVSLQLTPGITVGSFWTAFGAAWIAAIVGTGVAWLGSAGTDDALAASLQRRRPKPDPSVDTSKPGIIFVQLDGVPFPVLRWAIQAGSVPTIRRWLGSESHVLREWLVQLPCTTPASQQGILHGTLAGVPAFRWYDRELGRLLVANRPADAAIIEAEASDGLGLLADGGVSVSNLFTGDAERSAMTMSRLSVSRGSPITRRAVAWYLLRPEGFARSLSRTIAEIVKERFQARRQHRRNLQPSTHRGWTFAVLRAITNGTLRDLNTAVVADEMLRGTNSVYVNYVDYDEIAHHAGMFRPESLAALDGVDRVLATLEAIAARAPRPYHLVVMSDHGQSQGQPFAARTGSDLASLCADLTQRSVRSVDKPVEGWGRVEAVVDDVAAIGGAASKVAQAASSRVQDRVADATHSDPEDGGPDADPQLTVLGSGNLGLLYQQGDTRLSLEQIDTRWPHLVPGLVATEGVGFVGAIDDAGHPIVVGAHGRVDLTTGVVEGDHPLADFPPHAGRMLATAIAMPRAPDLYINSSVAAETLDVNAFEPLVGCHGGLGGWQDQGMLLCPSALIEACPPSIEGADQLHQALVRMLESVGHRQSLVASSVSNPDQE